METLGPRGSTDEEAPGSPIKRLQRRISRAGSFLSGLPNKQERGQGNPGRTEIPRVSADTDWQPRGSVIYTAEDGSRKAVAYFWARLEGEEPPEWLQERTRETQES